MCTCLKQSSIPACHGVNIHHGDRGALATPDIPEPGPRGPQNNSCLQLRLQIKLDVDTGPKINWAAI